MRTDYAATRAALLDGFAGSDPNSVLTQLRRLCWNGIVRTVTTQVLDAVHASSEPSPLRAPIIVEALQSRSFFEAEALAVRRLVDAGGASDRGRDVHSLPTTLAALRKCAATITRSGFVTWGGVPWSVEEGEAAWRKAGQQVFRCRDHGLPMVLDMSAVEGLPDARESARRHRLFDVWSGACSAPPFEQPLSRRLLDGLECEIKALRESDLVRAVDKFVAHAATARSRAPTAPTGVSERDQRKWPVGPAANELRWEDLRMTVVRLAAVADILSDLLLVQGDSRAIPLFDGEAHLRGLEHAALPPERGADLASWMEQQPGRFFNDLQEERRRMESRCAAGNA